MKTYIEKLRAFGFVQQQCIVMGTTSQVPTSEAFDRPDGWCIIFAEDSWSLHHEHEMVIKAKNLKNILDALPLSWASEVAKHDPDLVGTVLQELMPQYTRTVH